jgi:hypothetical protein
MTHKLGTTPLDEGPVSCRGLYLHNTQHSQEKNIHAPEGICIRNPRNRATADVRPRPRGHRYRQKNNV